MACCRSLVPGAGFLAPHMCALLDRHSRFAHPIVYCVGAAVAALRGPSGSDTQSASDPTEMAEILFMWTPRQIALSVLIFLVSTVACASAQTESPIPAKNIIARMAQAGEQNHAHFRPYVVTVDYKLFGKETVSPTSDVIAELTFVPPYLKSYAIRDVNGTHIGERIVRRMHRGTKTPSGHTHLSRFGSTVLPRLRPDCPARPILVCSATMHHN